MTRQREGEDGLILVNVLLFVAIAASVVMLMIAAGDAAGTGALRQREATRARAVAAGGEESAIVALRRDMLVAPDTDNRTEAWAALSERDAPIAGGSFDLAIADATGRLNLNALLTGDAGATMLLGRVAQAAGVPDDVATRAVALLRLRGPITDLSLLAEAGLDAGMLARLTPMVTALPYPTKINVNAADEATLATLLGDPLAARRLAALRDQRGQLTAADFASMGLSLPAGAAVTSDLFWVRVRGRIGDTAQQQTSLLHRRRAADGTPSVAVIGRWIGPRPPAQAPPLPF